MSINKSVTNNLLDERTANANLPSGTKDSVSHKKEQKKENVSSFQQIREIFESLAVALFLAFLFKTFEAEAFVIPTGSMAPTLKGRHKDVVCQECGYQFQTSASEEIDASCNKRNGRHVVAGTCPLCGFTQYFGDEFPDPKKDETAPSYTGDRILVSKLAFDQRPLERWDVSVFRSPSEPKINFIKRIVGLPNENLRVQYGDLFFQKQSASNFEDDNSQIVSENKKTSDESELKHILSPDVNLGTIDLVDNSRQKNVSAELNDEPFKIARKDYKYLRHMLQVVDDADYRAPVLDELGWPTRWYGKSWEVGETKRGRVFLCNSSLDIPNAHSICDGNIRLGTEINVPSVVLEDDQFTWLRYRHIVPSSEDWFYLSDGKLPPKVVASGTVANNPRLIDDFSGYNAGISRRAKFNGSSYEWSNELGDEFSLYSRILIGADGKSNIRCVKNPDGFGCNWVGDLAVSCELTVEKIDEQCCVIFDLVKGGITFRCSLLPNQKLIQIMIPNISQFAVKELPFEFELNKKYRVVFLNIDEELRVVIDEKELEFPNNGGCYDNLTIPQDNVKPVIARNRDPNLRDLSPVAIGVRGASLHIERLKVLRDVYYIAAGRMLENWNSDVYDDFGTGRCDRLIISRPQFNNENDVAHFMSLPSAWIGYGNTKSILLTQRENQYVAFGDNSGFSLDSRLWASDYVPHYVDRRYLIGKAFYVYWPHGLQLPLVNQPYWPNFKQMRHID